MWLDPCVVRGKAKLSSPAKKQVEKGKKMTDKTSGKEERSTVDGSPLAVLSPVSSPVSRSPIKGELHLKTQDVAHIFLHVLLKFTS